MADPYFELRNKSTPFQAIYPGVLKKIFHTEHTLSSPKMKANFKKFVCEQNFI